MSRTLLYLYLLSIICLSIRFCISACVTPCSSVTFALSNIFVLSLLEAFCFTIICKAFCCSCKISLLSGSKSGSCSCPPILANLEAAADPLKPDTSFIPASILSCVSVFANLCITEPLTPCKPAANSLSKKSSSD